MLNEKAQLNIEIFILLSFLFIAILYIPIEFMKSNDTTLAMEIVRTEAVKKLSEDTRTRSYFYYVANVTFEEKNNGQNLDLNVTIGKDINAPVQPFVGADFATTATYIADRTKYSIVTIIPK